VKEYYDVINVVYIHDERVFGSVEKLGAFASLVRYVKGGEEIEELLENSEFAIVDEIVFHHVEEENG
jgi:hypothetical protein